MGNNCMVSNPQSLDHPVAFLHKRAVNGRDKTILSGWKKLLLIHCFVVQSIPASSYKGSILYSAYIKRIVVVESDAIEIVVSIRRLYPPMIEEGSNFYNCSYGKFRYHRAGAFCGDE